MLGTRQGLQKQALLNLVLYGWSARLNPLVLAKLVEQFGQLYRPNITGTTNYTDPNYIEPNYTNLNYTGPNYTSPNYTALILSN